MSKKKKKKGKTLNQLLFPSSCKGMGTNVTGATFEEIKAVADIYQRSDTSHYVERLDEIINDQNYKMSVWEVEQLVKFYEKFAAKYTSPLAKALK